MSSRLSDSCATFLTFRECPNNPLGSQILILTHTGAAPNPTINTYTSEMITLISVIQLNKIHNLTPYPCQHSQCISVGLSHGLFRGKFMSNTRQRSEAISDPAAPTHTNSQQTKTNMVPLYRLKQRPSDPSVMAPVLLAGKSTASS